MIFLPFVSLVWVIANGLLTHSTSLPKLRVLKRMRAAGMSAETLSYLSTWELVKCVRGHLKFERNVSGLNGRELRQVIGCASTPSDCNWHRVVGRDFSKREKEMEDFLRMNES